MGRFLLVDDNAALGENLAEILRDAGHEVSLALTGKEGLELLFRTRYDALITDMRMPVMSGAQLLMGMRAIDPGMPAIVITAYTADDEMQTARDQGLLAVLPKPVPVARLIELLRVARRDGLVALVEDDPALADNLAEALRDRGFSTIAARSLVETERMRCLQPFVALVDMRLPGSSDGAALRGLSAMFPKLPLLATTAFADAVPQGSDVPVFQKPFSTAELLSAVERLHGKA